MKRDIDEAYAPGTERPAILLIAYGSCVATGLGVLHDFENRVRERYPGYPVRWAYTSDRIRSRLAVQVRRKSDSVVKAIRRLVLERFGPIIAQPLQIVPATENEVVEGLTQSVSRELGVPVSVGAPLLASNEDVRLCVRAMLSHLPQGRLSGEDVIFVGHGASHQAQACYAALSRLAATFDPHVHVATLSGDMPLQNVLPCLSSQRVFLVPLLSSVGKHTLRDIAGCADDSLKTFLEAKGHECVALKEGVLQHKAYADIWLSHLDAAMARAGQTVSLRDADAEAAAAEPHGVKQAETDKPALDR